MNDYSLWMPLGATAMLRCMDEGKWLKVAFGDLLRRRREERGLSQSQLALASGLDQTFVSLLERGRRQPTLSTVFALCEALGVAPDGMIRDLMTARGQAGSRASESE